MIYSYAIIYYIKEPHHFPDVYIQEKVPVLIEFKSFVAILLILTG